MKIIRSPYASSNVQRLILTGLASIALISSAPGQMITPVSYEFGTDPGRTTFGDAGFTAVATSPGQVSNVAEGVVLDRNDPPAGSFANVAILQAFSGLGGGSTNDFIVSTSFTLTAYDVANANNDRIGGIHLFADTADDAGINDTGFSLRLIGDSGTNNDDIEITLGLGGTAFVSADLGYDFALNDVFDLTATGTYSGTTFSLVFSVSRNGGAAQTIAETFDTVTDAALLDGTFSGVSARIKSTTGSEFSNLSVVPEPSSVALIGLGTVGLALWRRRRNQG